MDFAIERADTIHSIAHQLKGPLTGTGKLNIDYNSDETRCNQGYNVMQHEDSRFCFVLNIIL